MAYANNPQERLRGPERMDTRSRLDALRRDIQQQHPEQDAVAVANSIRLQRRPGQRGYVNERVRQYFGPDALQRIHGAVGRMEQTLDDPQRGLRARLDTLNFPPAQHQAIEKIMNALTQDGPDTVGQRARATYLTTRHMPRDTEGNRVARYSVHMGSARRGVERYPSEDPRSGIRRNQEWLREIGRNATPEQQMFLHQLINTMNEYAMRVDSRQVYMHDYRHMRHTTPIREKGRQLGRLGVVIAGGAAATITGVMSLFSGNLSITPFLYSGLAMYAANPHLLDGRARRGAVQAGRVVNWQGFRQYQPQGPEWAGIVDQINSGNTEVRTFLRRPTNETGAAVLDTLAPAGSVSEGTRQTLRTMIERGDFATFAQRIRGVRDSDARELVHDYVERGAVRYAA